MAKIPRKVYVGKYWICKFCADKKGWIGPKDGCTVISGRCSWCKDSKEQTMIPLVDFKRGKIEPIFD